jgi:hypothetical protein
MDSDRTTAEKVESPGFIGVMREMSDAARVGGGFAVKFNPRIFLGSVPLGVFWLSGLFWGTQFSIGMAFIAATAVFFYARDSGIIRLLAVLSFSAVTIAAIAGAVLNSDKAFLANDVIFDYTTVVVSIISIYKGKPLFRLIMYEMYPGLKSLLPEAHRVFITTTIILALHSIVIGTTRIFLIATQSVGEYIIWSRVTSLTVNTIVITSAIVLMGRAVIIERRKQGSD